MQEDLQKNWQIKSDVVYDKANTDVFQPIDIQQKHRLFQKLGFTDKAKFSSSLSLEQDTIFTQVKQKQNLSAIQSIPDSQSGHKLFAEYEYRDQRPLLLVSSCSWTKDDAFDILFKSLEDYDEIAQKSDKYFPFLYQIITGKGPEKEKYEQIIKQKQKHWKKIKIETKWLQADDYPLLLASADLGICLHTSTSGFDLPMKVVDMFGAGLPAFAINYQSIAELVVDKKNGRIFDDDKDLTKLFVDMFQEWPKNFKELDKYKYNAVKFRDQSFSQEWKNNVLPIIQDISQNKKIKQKEK